MTNRDKIILFIMLFWIVFSTVLILVGFPAEPVFIFAIIGTVFFNLLCIILDSHNTKFNKWFDSTKFFKK